MMPHALYYMYNQSAGYGIFTSWEAVVMAGIAVVKGISRTIQIDRTILTFENGVLTNVAYD